MLGFTQNWVRLAGSKSYVQVGTLAGGGLRILSASFSEFWYSWQDQSKRTGFM